MLWLALAGRSGGQRPSSLLKIKSGVVALDFDLACALRLLQFDREMMQESAKLIAYEAGKIFVGGEQTVEDSGATDW
jgi:hypothetical protein